MLRLSGKCEKFCACHALRIFIDRPLLVKPDAGCFEQLCADYPGCTARALPFMQRRDGGSFRVRRVLYRFAVAAGIALSAMCAANTDGKSLRCMPVRSAALRRHQAAFIYEWPLAPLIHHYRYAGNLALARFFAHALTASIKAPVDAIIPMPLSPQRLRERGFNQALEIAREVSRVKGIALLSGACRRVRDSTPQAGLPWSARAKNIRGAFVCDIDLPGKRVAVLDDVLTTGSTLNEIARNLRKAGASEVHGWMMARTLHARNVGDDHARVSAVTVDNCIAASPYHSL